MREEKGWREEGTEGRWSFYISIGYRQKFSLKSSVGFFFFLNHETILFCMRSGRVSYSRECESSFIWHRESRALEEWFPE